MIFVFIYQVKFFLLFQNIKIKHISWPNISKWTYANANAKRHDIFLRHFRTAVAQRSNDFYKYTKNQRQR